MPRTKRSPRRPRLIHIICIDLPNNVYRVSNTSAMSELSNYANPMRFTFSDVSRLRGGANTIGSEDSDQGRGLQRRCSTKPFIMGATLPATCVVGQAFFNSAATAGANWYACTSTNTWTLPCSINIDGLGVKSITQKTVQLLRPAAPSQEENSIGFFTTAPSSGCSRRPY